ncbi:MAG: hypothetical protein K2Y39_09100 [Candidatus Obscuribacterales bacterium]|nr:hypothetical protein [Candidatus Obscuribacterales bacterium]
MKINFRRPKSFIYYYCFVCVFIGCVEATINAHLFEARKTEITPLRIVTIKPKAEEGPPVEAVQNQWEGCPTKESVGAAVKDCSLLIANTQALLDEILNEADAEQRRLDKKVAMWKEEVRVWEIKNSSRLNSCWFLLGATGYAVHPELPIALENLKRSGNWLERSVESAQRGDFNAANEYILAARRATKQAGKLVNGKVRPKSKYALVKLPRHLANRKKTSST